MKKEINSFIELPESIKKNIFSFYVSKIIFKIKENTDNILNPNLSLNYKILNIIKDFKKQFVQIDENSYNFLKEKSKKIEKNFNMTEIEKDFKEKSELSEFINYYFLESIFDDIKKENDNITSIEINKAHNYSDIKTGVVNCTH